jgi:hypothetical protein
MICPYIKSWQMLRNRLPSCFLFREMVRNGIPRVCFYVCSTERNPSCFLFFGIVQTGIPRFCFFFVPWYRISSIFLFRKMVRNGTLTFLFHCTEFRGFFSSAKRFGTEFREFSVPRNSRNPAGTNQLFLLFCLRLKKFFVGNCQPYL